MAAVFVDRNGNSFECTIYPLGFIVIALILLKLRVGHRLGSKTQKKPKLNNFVAAVVVRD